MHTYIIYLYIHPSINYLSIYPPIRPLFVYIIHPPISYSMDQKALVIPHWPKAWFSTLDPNHSEVTFDPTKPDPSLMFVFTAGAQSTVLPTTHVERHAERVPMTTVRIESNITWNFKNNYRNSQGIL